MASNVVSLWTLKNCFLKWEKLLSKVEKWSECAFSIIYVEISGHELRTVGRKSKLKNKIWHSGHYRHIALLKRTHKKVKIRYYCSVYIYKTTRMLSEKILAVSPGIWHTKRDELALLSIPFNHQNQLEKPSLIYCVTWLCKLFPCPMTCSAKSKLVNATN